MKKTLSIKKECPNRPCQGLRAKEKPEVFYGIYLKSLILQAQKPPNTKTCLLPINKSIPDRPRTEAEINKHIICVCLRIIKRANAKDYGRYVRHCF